MSDNVILPRRQVRGLYWAVIGFLVATLLLGGPLLWFAVQQELTNNHQAATDRRLGTLIRAEREEEQVEDADACASQWERVPQLRQAIALSVREGSTAGAGAVIDVTTQLLEDPLPPETDILLEQAVDERVRNVVGETVARYPDPACDLAHALIVIDRARRDESG